MKGAWLRGVCATLVLCFDCFVALTGSRLQTAPIKDGHSPPCIMNHLLILETTGSPRHHRACHTEYHRHELVLHLKFIPLRAVMREQQQARE
jgi:hypothetical protein